MKKAISFRLSLVANHLIKKLKIEKGLSEAAVIELAVRNMAKESGLSIPTEKELLESHPDPSEP